MAAEFEDFIDKLQFEPLYVDTEVDFDAICGYNDQGDLLCETVTTDEVVPTDVHSSSKDDLQVLELANVGSIFNPLYNAFSILSSFNPYDYISYQNKSVEDDGVKVDVADHAVIELSGFNLYDRDDVEVIVVDLNFTQVGDLFKRVRSDFNDVIVKLDENTVNLGAADLSVERDSEYSQNQIDKMQLNDEFAVGETIKWHQQAFKGFVFLIFLLVLRKFVQLHKRARPLRTSDRNTPLLTVTVEKQETSKAGEMGSYVPPGETGSYVPPRCDTKKNVDAEKLDTQPYLVFI